MPKFMKDNALVILDGAFESYILALYGMSLPAVRSHRKVETRYAPIMGLLGASVELFAKACLVQARGLEAMYKDEDTSTGIYKFGTEVLSELKALVKSDSKEVRFLWKDENNHSKEQQEFVHYLDKFKLVQQLRANGLHAGIGCSRDITLSVFHDVYRFIVLLSQGKKLKAYLKNIPGPEETIRDREAIIEDLSRRMSSADSHSDKLGYLRNMYIVLPFIPEIAPDWIEAFDKAIAVPPSVDDVNYLAKTLSDAHSIYLLKNRGGKEGIAVRVENKNPNALPIAIQNIKRELSSIPDKFNNDILTANTRLSEGRLDLPIDDFLIDLYALGLEKANVFVDGATKLTAQQAWPYIASAISTQGNPRPCFFFVKACDEIDKLIAILEGLRNIGNGYLKRRIDTVIQCIRTMQSGERMDYSKASDSVYREITDHVKEKEQFISDPFDHIFIKKNPLSEEASCIIHEYKAEGINAGTALEKLLQIEEFGDSEKKYATQLLRMCTSSENINGLVAVLRTKKMEGYVSQARKMMFFIDTIENGPQVFK